MSKSYDLCIIGAGPAGMEAALCAQDFGISVLVLDENMQAGGQIYRQADVADSEILTALGVEYDTGLCQRFMQAAINFECGARVWDIADQCVFFINNRGQSCKIAARRIIIATGAMERPAIVSGWQLPGCMGAGAVQSLLKGSNIVPVGKFVLAGSGPLLLLLAVQLL
ncbi:MAG: FAD-dependent oxidoreductase, partial [Pseudomonadota bacterium]